MHNMALPWEHGPYTGAHRKYVEKVEKKKFNTVIKLQNN